MTLPRRDFLKKATVAGVGGSTLGAAGAFPGSDTGMGEGGIGQESPAAYGKSVHTVLERNPPFIYVDPCMQIWPDADFHLAHRHGVTAYGVTAWDPHADVRAATDGIMYWHGIAREHDGLEVVEDGTGHSAVEAGRKGGPPPGCPGRRLGGI